MLGYIRRVARAPLAKAMRSWHGWAEAHAQKRLDYDRMILRIVNGRLAPFFDAWAQILEGRRRRMQRARFILAGSRAQLERPTIEMGGATRIECST